MSLRVRASVRLQARPEQVFAVLSDPARFHEWQAGMAPADAPARPVGAGSRLRSRRSFAGRTVPFSSEVTVWDPPRQLSFRSVRTPLAVTGEYCVDPDGAGSRVTATLEVGPPAIGFLRLGAFGPGASPLGDRARSVMVGQLQQDLEMLAVLVDGPDEQGAAPR